MTLAALLDQSSNFTLFQKKNVKFFFTNQTLFYHKIFYNIIFFFHLVGITWDDAPTEQNAVINTDYKIRCVVLASPPATIDWLKESLIVSTGRTLLAIFYFIKKILLAAITT